MRRYVTRTAAAVAVAMLAGAAGCAPTDETPSISPRDAYIDARSTLLQAADDPDPFTRVHAMEAMAQTLGDKAGGVYLQALDDPSPIVQFAAAMAVAQTQYDPALEKLREMAEKEGPDKRTYAAVIFALHVLGDDSHTGDLARLLRHREKEVRASAAMVMGMMGEPSAIGPLKSLLADEQDAAVRLQIVEALALLGEQKYEILMEAYTKTQYLEDRLVAIQAMRRMRSRSTLQVLEEMLEERQPPRVKVAAAGALAYRGEVTDANYQLCLSAVEQPLRMLRQKFGEEKKIDETDVNSLRRLGIMGLGWMGRSAAVDRLHPLLKASDGGVKVAAAMSILQLVPDFGDDEPEDELDSPSPRDQAGGAVKRPKIYSAGAKD